MADIINVSSVDGWVEKVQAGGVWGTVRTGAGTTVNSIASTLSLICQLFSGTFNNRRSFLQFNTGVVLSNDATIDAVDLVLVLLSKNTFHDITSEAIISSSSQVSETALFLFDYSQVVVNTPPEWGGRLPLDVFPSVKLCPLNKTGIDGMRRKNELSTGLVPAEGWVLMSLRGDRDVDNVSPGFIDINCNMGSFESTFFIPTLAITWHKANIQEGVVEDGTIE